MDGEFDDPDVHRYSEHNSFSEPSSFIANADSEDRPSLGSKADPLPIQQTTRVHEMEGDELNAGKPDGEPTLSPEHGVEQTARTSPFVPQGMGFRRDFSKLPPTVRAMLANAEAERKRTVTP